MTPVHLATEQLQAGLTEILRSPLDNGIVQRIVCRPRENEREVLQEAQLDTALGLLGDNWKARGNRRAADGQANPEAQITVMNSRVAALVAQFPDRWPLAGDQIFADLNLSTGNLPPGTRLRVGTAELQVSALPHTGCAKFVSRFGMDAMNFVNSPEGRRLGLRGINARVRKGGCFKVGDLLTKL